MAEFLPFTHAAKTPAPSRVRASRKLENDGLIITKYAGTNLRFELDKVPDLSIAHRVAHQVEAGMVWINEYYAHEMVLPFGGYKQSGIGKDYSMHALEAYSQLKEVAVRLP